jgi:hypothetical protein
MNFPHHFTWLITVTSNRELTSELTLITDWELPSISPINPGIWHAGECSDLYCCTWRRGGHMTHSYCCAIQNLQRRLETLGVGQGEERGGEAKHGENIAHYCCAITFWGFCISTVPHGVITPHCSLLKAVRLSSFLPRAVLVTSVIGVAFLPVVRFLPWWSLSNCYIHSLLMCAHPERHPEKLQPGPGVLPSSST